REPQPGDLRLALARHAARAYHDAVRVRSEAEAMAALADEDDRRGFAPWVDRALYLEDDAARSLSLLVMQVCGRIVHDDEAEALSPGWEPCVYELDGLAYVVTSYDDHDDPSPRLSLAGARSVQSGQYDE